MAILSRFASAGCRAGVSKVFKSHAARPALIRLLPHSQVLSTGVTKQNKGGWLSEESCEAKPGTNRWAMFLPAFLTHVSLGSPYGWSAISGAIARDHGFVVSAASDWSLELATYPMSIIMAAGGIGAALVGKWTLDVGVRKAMAVGGGLFGAGFLMTAAGVHLHSLPLMYTGNLIAGLGYGCAYTPPIQALINWFPDKKGLASGLVIGGFGSGALFFTPAMNALCQKFSTLPTYLGTQLDLVVEGGRQFTRIGDSLQEVVYATASDISKLPYEGLAEGFYVVGSGNTGVTPALAAIGVVYGANILLASMLIRRPAAGYLPAGYTPPDTQGGAANVPVDSLLKTPQFWLLWSTATLLATGGMGLMSVAKPMIQNVFTDAMPLLVTTGFASAYLMAMAGGNLGGRIGWAAVSDKIGRWNTFQMFTFVAIPIYAGLPFLINQCVANPTGPLAAVYLGGFCASTVIAISIMGGVFAVLPAYEADLYGAKYIGAIHGRFLTFAAASTVAGPTLLLNLKKVAETDAINGMLAKVDPQLFLEKFGCGLDGAQSLIQAKTLTINKMMTIMPQGTIDPSPFLYNNTMYTMAGLVSCAAVLHFMVKPVDKKYFERAEAQKSD